MLECKLEIQSCLAFLGHCHRNNSMSMTIPGVVSFQTQHIGLPKLKNINRNYPSVVSITFFTLFWACADTEILQWEKQEVKL